MTGRDQTTLSAAVGLWCCAILFAGAVSTCASTVRADDTADTEAGLRELAAETQLVLAQAAVAECGWVGAHNDCPAAVWHRFEQQQTDLGTVWRPLARVARDYCRAWRRKDWPRKWVKALLPPGQGAPRSWPKSSSWERRRADWARIYQRAGRFLLGRVADPCQGYALHFGNDEDARRDGSTWVATDCGDTGRQRFGWWQKGQVR